MRRKHDEIESIREVLAEDIYKKVVALYFENMPVEERGAFLYLEAAKVLTLAYNQCVDNAFEHKAPENLKLFKEFKNFKNEHHYEI